MKTVQRAFQVTFALLIAVAFFGSRTTNSVTAQTKAPSQVSVAPGPMIDGSPLDVITQDGLAMAVYYNGAYQFYRDTDGGTFLTIDGVIYGTTPAAGGALAPIPFTPVSNSAVSGSGTRADPFTIVTVASAGTTGVQVTQTTTYVNGDFYYGVDWTIANTGSATHEVRAFYAADLYLNFPGNDLDFGYGIYDPASGAVGITSNDRMNIQVLIPFTPVTAYEEASYDTIWSNIGSGSSAGPGMNNTFDPAYTDGGAALQWDRSLAAGASTNIHFHGAFGPATEITAPTATPTATGVPAPTATATRVPAVVVQYRSANVHVVIRPEPNHVAARGSIVACTMEITNRGEGSAGDAAITMALDPATVSVIDASFGRRTVWVSQLLTNSLTLNTGRLANGGDAITATVRLRVLDNAADGGSVCNVISVNWKDDVRGGRRFSNRPIVVVGASNQTQTYTLVASPSSGPAGTKFFFTGTVFAPSEPVGVWYNAPNGTVVSGSTFYAKDDGSIVVSFADKVTPGFYSMVFYGHWTKFTAVGTFEVK